ncbi:MAG: NAD(P)H-binding protein [Candidatus Zixiibacteriota bacterium]|nr:MAG: NAD(P)H-binding protein [candidate division Zixibacteria bacterium]
MPAKILVIGGTGMLGRPVANRLKADGFDVTVMSTNSVRAARIMGEGFNIVQGDVTDIESLKRPLAEHEYVYLNLNSQLDPKKYEAIEIDGTAYVAAVAASSGVKRIGMISGASSRGLERGIIYLDAKVKAEKAVIGSGVPYSIMRPSWFFESLPNFVQRGRATILGKQPNKIGWLAASDFARQVSTAFQKKEAANRCFYNLGPSKMTIMEALTKFCERHYPELEPKSMSYGTARVLSYMPGMGTLKNLVPFMKYFEDYDEDVDPSQANRILGANETTIDQWLDTWQKP